MTRSSHLTIAGMDRSARRQITSSWPLVRWVRSGGDPVRLWWMRAVAAAFGAGAAAAMLTRNLLATAGVVVWMLVVGLPIGFARYRVWLQRAAGVPTWRESRRAVGGPFDPEPPR